jgi:PucR family transcriptional regulator, purine catabolism regulatory protein
MPVTVKDLLALPGLGLTLVAGQEGIDRPIRWAHTSELQDPTPWLSGGELLLTTGMGLKGSAGLQRAYVRRLVEAGGAGLGFGLGFSFDEVPATILRAADREGLPVLEVPYPVPFIAIAEAVSSRLTDDRVRDAQLSVEVHERLASLVAGGAGPADVLDEIVDLSPGWTALFDPSGRVVARSHHKRVGAPDPEAILERLPAGLIARGRATSGSDLTPGGAQVVHAVTAGRRHEGVLVFGKEGRVDQRDRIAVHHAVTVLGLLLASRRAVIDAERRVAGDVLNEAFAGRLTGPDLERRLELIGFRPGGRVAVLVMELPGAAPNDLDELLWRVDATLGARSRSVRTSVVGSRIAALVAHPDPEWLALEVHNELAAGADGPASARRVGVGEMVEPGSIRQSYLSALFALRAGRPHKAVTSPRDLGSYGLLLGAQPRPVLEGFVRSVLGPLIDRDEERSSDLVASVKAFVEAGGRWEPGAGNLGVHRHTLRYRVRQAEELLGRDLSDPQDQMEVWLALKAADILEH